MLDLLKDNNLPQFLLCFMPVLSYAFLIYLTLPKETVSIKNCTLYFFLGLLSAECVVIFNYIFPGWQSKPIYKNDLQTSLLLYTVVQVGLLEEGMKLFCFTLSTKYREIKNRLTPLGIMFLCICVSCGFAVDENIDYIHLHASNILWIRTFSALIGHMIFGAIQGYFLAFMLIKKHEKWFRKLPYLIAAIILPGVTHGMYDYSYMANPDSFSAQYGGAITILIIGSFVTYLMRVDLERRSI